MVMPKDNYFFLSLFVFFFPRKGIAWGRKEIAYLTAGSVRSHAMLSQARKHYVTFYVTNANQTTQRRREKVKGDERSG